jgi:hypothetical protein
MRTPTVSVTPAPRGRGSNTSSFSPPGRDDDNRTLEEQVAHRCASALTGDPREGNVVSMSRVRGLLTAVAAVALLLVFRRRRRRRTKRS